MSVALTVAGSDSGGGAGIQADIKTFSAFGVYGASVITAVTAQNTVGVTAVHDIPIDVITAQMDAVLSDFTVGAAKTGMLSSGAIVEVVSDGFRRHGVRNLVVDPVMVAKSGDRLLRADAVEALRTLLLPLALVVTPNIPEAEDLIGGEIRSEDDRRSAAREIARLGPRVVVVKGGHLDGDPVDVVWDGRSFRELSARRIRSGSTHGTGCTFSAAIAALLSRGAGIEEALSGAKDYVTGAIAAAQGLGHGHGPLNHHFRNQHRERVHEH